MRHVLIVDDEARVVDGLRKGLRTFREQWHVEVATSGEAALGQLEQQAFDVVITDARMPGIDGEALLRQLSHRWPRTMRVVLSGDTKAESAERMLLLAHQFLAKPIAPKGLFARVEQALEARARLTSERLATLMGRIGALPASPSTSAALSKAMRSIEYRLGEIALIIESDPAICANVLRLVNSAYFGLASHVTSVSEAVRLLGANPLRSVVLAAELFHDSPFCERLKQDALVRLRCTRKLGSLFNADASEVETAGTAAIVCDVGQQLLAHKCSDDFARAQRLADEGLTLSEAEERLFGANHATLGGALLGSWGLPHEVVDAVVFHHQPQASPTAQGLVSIACLAQDLLHAPEPLKPRLRAQLDCLCEATPSPAITTETILALAAPGAH